MKERKKKGASIHYPNGLNGNPKRLAIFLYYDKDGIVDDYIPYLINDLKQCLERIVIVINGYITTEGRARLKELTEDVFVRDNEGFDAAGWKEAMIDYLGWDEIEKYDELILLNDTFFGPFYSFKEIFAQMNTKPIDFWGLTSHGEMPIDGINAALCPYPTWPEHIQSYFIVIRKAMHKSYEFRRYWEKQPTFASRDEAINKNEVVLTKHFTDAGFVWDVLVDTKDLDGNAPINHYMYNAYEILSKLRYPIIKRRNFAAPYREYLDLTVGNQAKKALEYIDKHTNYDINLILDNILRVYNISDIYNNLHLNYILPKETLLKEKHTERKAVVVFHIGYIDMLDYLKQYICSIPEDLDIILTTKPEKNCEIVRSFFEPYLRDRLTVLCAKDPGRDLSALLVTARPKLLEYDYICFCHDKKSSQSGAITVGAGFQENIIENTLASKAYIMNVINCLEENEYLGLLSTPCPHHGIYFWTVGNRWTCCYEETKRLAKQLNLNVDISPNHQPLAIGTAFWCKKDALLPLFEYPWVHDDFPKEPLPDDGTLNHALERILPFVAQSQGYLTGWVMTDEYAAVQITNTQYMLDELVRASGRAFPSFLAFEDYVRGNKIGVKGALIIYIKKHLPKPFWGIARLFKKLIRW